MMVFQSEKTQTMHMLDDLDQFPCGAVWNFKDWDV